MSDTLRSKFHNLNFFLLPVERFNVGYITESQHVAIILAFKH